MTVQISPQAPLWAQNLVASLNQELVRRAPVPLKSYTTDELPDVTQFSGYAVWNTTISRVCVSDGTNWLRQDTGASV